jgi:hypothetical protein
LNSYARIATLTALLLSAACGPSRGQKAISRDEATPVGFTAAEVVATVQRKVTGTLEWHSIADVPKTLSGTTDVTVETDCTGGQSRLLEDSSRSPDPWIEVDCVTTIVSADGGLKDSWPTVVYAQHSPYGLTHSLRTAWVGQSDVGGALQGDLRLEPGAEPLISFSMAVGLGDQEWLGVITWKAGLDVREDSSYASPAGPIAELRGPYSRL